MSNTALTTRKPLTPDVWQMISTIAPAMHASRLFGVSSPEQAMAIMLKGHDLGLSPTAAFEFISVIQGKPGLNPRGALALIHNAPELDSMSINRLTTDKGQFVGYEVNMKRKGGFQHTARFTIEDATRAGLIKKESGWEKYPENMCLWRAVGFAADVVFPDVCGGMKTADQYGANITATGDVVVEGEWTVGTPHAPAESNHAEPDHNDFLAALVDMYGAEKVMEVNGGSIPTTAEEVTAVAEKLNGASRATSN